MDDDVEVSFLGSGERELRKVAARDPGRFNVLHALIAQIEEDGWHLSVRSELIKVLRSGTRVGEIRDLGPGGYRLFFFWIETGSGKELLVARVLPKRDVEGRARLNTVIASVEAVRARYLDG